MKTAKNIIGDALVLAGVGVFTYGLWQWSAIAAQLVAGIALVFIGAQVIRK